MALIPQARIVFVAWDQGTFKGSVRMSLGTLRYLGLNENNLKLNTTTYQQTAKEIARKQYPGGPSPTYIRKAKTVTRLVGGRVSTAAGGDIMYLEASDGTTDTIRVTGNKRAFAEWLKANKTMGNTGDTIVLRNRNGTTYATINEGATTLSSSDQDAADLTSYLETSDG